MVGVVLSRNVGYYDLSRLMFDVDGELLLPYLKRPEGIITFSSSNRGDLLVPPLQSEGNDFEFTVAQDADQTLRSIGWMNDRTLDPIIGLTIDTTDDSGWPQNLQVGQRCAILINGFYYVYYRGENGYTIDVLMSERYANKPLGVIYDFANNIVTLKGIFVTEDIYLTDEGDILNPVGLEPFPAPLPDHIGFTTEYVGPPTWVWEI